MEQIVITRSDSSTWSLYSKSNVTQVVRAEQRKTLLGEDVIAMTVVSAVKLDFYIRDRITVFGENYFLNNPPQYKKSGTRKHQYELIWEGRQYDLLKAFYLDEGDDGVSISPDFSLTGDLEFFMDVLINNCDRVFTAGKWVLGTCPATDSRTLTFSNEKCLAVLQRLCKDDVFDKEFEIIENAGVCTINIKDTIGQTHATTYEYGRGKGLWDLTRDTISEKDIVTRLYVFGSNKNLKSDYRGFSQRLKIPIVDLSYIEDESAISQYGLIEGVKVFDNIYSHRTGSISSLGSTVFEFIDSSMSFDLNAVDGFGDSLYLLPGITPKVHFNTGNLAGYEFGISSYDHNTKKFTIQQFADDRGQTFPDENSSAFQFSAGDEYVLLDIVLPQTYIDDAEDELETAGEAYFNLVKQPRVQYSQVFDELYFKQKYSGQPTVNVFGIGDSVHIKDTDIGVDKAIRLKSFRRDVVRPYRYAIDLYDYDEETLVNKLVSSANETSKVLSATKLNDNSAAYDQLLIKSLLSCFVIVNSGTSDAYLRCKLPLAGDYNIQGYSDFSQFPTTIWDDMPVASGSVLGGIKVGSGLTISAGVLSIAGGVGTWGQITGTLADQTDLYNALTAKADLVGGVIPSAQLPSFVDDVLEYANQAAFPGTGESGKIYVALDTNVTYRWGGSAYVEISQSLALGETSSTAYRGDRGKTAYDFSQGHLSAYNHDTMIHYTGSPAANQVAIFADGNSITGTSGITYTNGALLVAVSNTAVSLNIQNTYVDNLTTIGIASAAAQYSSQAVAGDTVYRQYDGNTLFVNRNNATGCFKWIHSTASGQPEVVDMILNINGYLGLGATPTHRLTIAENRDSDVATYIYNTHATGFGAKIRGGGASNYALQVVDYNDTLIANFTTSLLAVSGAVKGTSLKTTNWSFEESGNDLLIKRGSTTLAKITSAGVIQAADNIQGGVTF